MPIHYRRILELHAQEMVQRDIASVTGNSRPKISEVIKQANLSCILTPLFTYLLHLTYVIKIPLQIIK